MAGGAALLLVSAPAAAARGDVGLALEAGGAAISLPEEGGFWGGLGGASVAVGLGELLWLQAHLDHKRMPGRSPALEVTCLGATLRYDLDLLAVRPYAELGLARVVATAADAVLGPELVPVLGLGVDVVSSGWLLWGAVVRYYPLFGSQLDVEPAYLTIGARLGVVLGQGR